MIINALENLDNFCKFIEEEIYSQFITLIMDDLRSLHLRITEEHIKNSNKGDIKSILVSIQGILDPIIKD